MTQGMGANIATGAAGALSQVASSAFQSPNKLVAELSGILAYGLVAKLPKEAEARVQIILAELKASLPNLSPDEVPVVKALLQTNGNLDQLIGQAGDLKKFVGDKWGPGWKFIFEKFEVLKAHLMGQKDDSGLITSLTQKTVDSLKVGFVGIPSPILENARQGLAQLLKEKPDIEVGKKALEALLEKPKEAFAGGKELSPEDKAVLEALQVTLVKQADIPHATLVLAIKGGLAILEKYAVGIQQGALIPSIVKSLFESLQKRVNGADEPGADGQAQLAGAIPPPNGAKKSLTYGAAFEGYIESAIGFFGHAVDRQMALRYASSILWGLELALKNTGGDATKEKPIKDAMESIKTSIKKIETAPSDVKIKDLVEEMTKDFRTQLDHLQIYLNSVKLPIHTVEGINVPIETLLEVEEPPAPAVAHATDEQIQEEVQDFTTKTIAFVRKKFGHKPFDAFYIRGFTRKVMDFVNSYVETHGAEGDKYFQTRKDVTLQSDKFFRVLKTAIDNAKQSGEAFEVALAKELTKSEKGITGKEGADTRTPKQIYDEFMNWVVDHFAPEHEWCKDMAEAFGRARVTSPWLNIPLIIITKLTTWVLTPFVFVAQAFANWVSPSLLKRIARKTELLPTLIATSEQAMGFNDEYQYAKDKALKTQLEKLWKALKHSNGDGEEIVVSDDMKGRLQDLASDVLIALDAHHKRLNVSSTGIIPEEWIDALAKGQAIDGLVQGLALALNVEFDKTNLKDQTLNVLQVLKGCYEDSVPVSQAVKVKMEKDLNDLVHKIVFFFVNKSIRDKFNPTTTYQREAADWVAKLKVSASPMMVRVDTDRQLERYGNMKNHLLGFMAEQYDRVLELQGNEKLDISTREMLKNLLGGGALSIHKLLEKIDETSGRLSVLEPQRQVIASVQHILEAAHNTFDRVTKDGFNAADTLTATRQLIPRLTVLTKTHAELSLNIRNSMMDIQTQLDKLIKARANLQCCVDLTANLATPDNHPAIIAKLTRETNKQSLAGGVNEVRILAIHTEHAQFEQEALEALKALGNGDVATATTTTLQHTTEQLLKQVAEIADVKTALQAEVTKVKTWADGLKTIPFLNIKAFDTDPFLDIITKVGYARYKPAADGIMQLARKTPVVEGLIRQVVMLPVLSH